MEPKELFELFIRETGADVVLRQEQVCSNRGGAKQWNAWRRREIISVQNLIAEYDSMLDKNHERNNPSDWYIGMIGTPPVFVLDDVTPEQLARIQDEFGAFAVVETSPGNYHVWIRLRSDKKYLLQDDWHLIQRELQSRYSTDRGSSGENHMFRLPIPGTYSHKRAQPYLMKITISEAEPKMSADGLLTQIQEEKKGKENNRPRNNRSMGKRGSASSRNADIPDWFLEKWARRKEELLASPGCPRRPDGTPDQSTVEYRLALQTMRGYRKRDEATKARVREMLSNVLENEAESRGKPNPSYYAERTISGAWDYLASSYEDEENE